MSKVPCVIIESPYTGDTSRNVRYALQAMHYSLLHGEAPYLSHLLYPHVLNDHVASEREMGLKASNAWIVGCDYMVLCCDFGISSGMQRAARKALGLEPSPKRPVFLRWLNVVRPDVRIIAPNGQEPQWDAICQL